MHDLAIYEEIVRLTKGGTAFALATVIETGGSAPRKAGAKMLVRSDGTTLGTVGGGRVEAETIRTALATLAGGPPVTLPFVLTEEHGFVCGGQLTVYVEPLGVLPRLVIFGAGHVGAALAPLARSCGYHVTVVDERPELANSTALPGADAIVCAPLPEAFSRLTITAQTAIVIATNGHELDFMAARGALGTEAGFIGLVGSRRKREVLRETLEREGTGEKEIARIVSPVGIAIGAETPAEIAVSIVGQLIRERRCHASSGDSDAPGRRRVAADGALQAAPPP